MLKQSLLAAALAALVAMPATAGPLKPGQIAGTLTGGIEAPISGDVHGGATAPVADLGALNPALAGVAAELRIQARGFDDIYDQSTAFGAELAYGLDGDREVFGAVKRIQSDAGQVQVGTAFVPALSASLPVFGRFSEFKSTTIEGGLRQYFDAGTFKPYVAGRIGAAVTDEITADFTIPSAPAGGIAIRNARFYDDGTVLTAGVDVGVSFAVGETGSIGLETGLRWSGKLKDNDSSIGGLGLARINDEGNRLAVPVMVRGRIAF
jgi:hypothetical protein